MRLRRRLKKGEAKMAELEIIYREALRCAHNSSELCEQCISCLARDMPCSQYSECDNGEDGCDNAYFDYAYKGLNTKKYDIREHYDGYSPRVSCMVVTVGKHSYDCEKVTLNRECIYNMYDKDDA